MPNLTVPVEFKANATKKTLYHKGKRVPLDPAGKGKISVAPNVDEVLLAEVEGAQPGSVVEILLTVQPPARLEMVEFKEQVALNRTVWASSRFFRVKT